MHCSETMLDANIIRHYPVAICTLRHLWTSAIFLQAMQEHAIYFRTMQAMHFLKLQAMYYLMIHQTQSCNLLDCPFFLFKANSVLCLLMPGLTWSTCLLNPKLHLSNFFFNIHTGDGLFLGQALVAPFFPSKIFSAVSSSSL